MQIIFYPLLLSLSLSVLVAQAADEKKKKEQVWVYVQKTGKLYLLDHLGAPRPKEATATGYSGHGDGLNNPLKENVRNVGPIPAGKWKIGDKFDHPRIGPVTMSVTPDGHDALGRTEFLIHGDNKKMNMSASEGCIILDRKTREMIANSNIKSLIVEKE